jgi:hypothetical protein
VAEVVAEVVAAAAEVVAAAAAAADRLDMHLLLLLVWGALVRGRPCRLVMAATRADRAAW